MTSLLLTEYAAEFKFTLKKLTNWQYHYWKIWRRSELHICFRPPDWTSHRNIDWNLLLQHYISSVSQVCLIFLWHPIRVMLIIQVVIRVLGSILASLPHWPILKQKLPLVLASSFCFKQVVYKKKKCWKVADMGQPCVKFALELLTHYQVILTCLKWPTNSEIKSLLK